MIKYIAFIFQYFLFLFVSVQTYYQKLIYSGILTPDEGLSKQKQSATFVDCLLTSSSEWQNAVVQSSPKQICGC